MRTFIILFLFALTISGIDESSKASAMHEKTFNELFNEMRAKGEEQTLIDAYNKMTAAEKRCPDGNNLQHPLKPYEVLTAYKNFTNAFKEFKSILEANGYRGLIPEKNAQDETEYTGKFENRYTEALLKIAFFDPKVTSLHQEVTNIMKTYTDEKTNLSQNGVDPYSYRLSLQKIARAYIKKFRKLKNSLSAYGVSPEKELEDFYTTLHNTPEKQAMQSKNATFRKTSMKPKAIVEFITKITSEEFENLKKLIHDVRNTLPNIALLKPLSHITDIEHRHREVFRKAVLELIEKLKELGYTEALPTEASISIPLTQNGQWNTVAHIPEIAQSYAHVNEAWNTFKSKQMSQADEKNMKAAWDAVVESIAFLKSQLGKQNYNGPIPIPIPMNDPETLKDYRAILNADNDEINQGVIKEIVEELEYGINKREINEESEGQQNEEGINVQANEQAGEQAGENEQPHQESGDNNDESSTESSSVGTATAFAKKVGTLGLHAIKGLFNLGLKGVNWAKSAWSNAS